MPPIMTYEKSLNPEKALIWRIVHRDNVPWILDNGLHCGNSAVRSPSWVDIGKATLISARASQPVQAAPGGVINDYVPFYFTPFSVMMNNIITGYNGVKKRGNDEIVLLVSSLHKVRALGLPFVFTDSHASYQWANFYNDLSDLDKVDWPLLQQRDFRKNPEHPERFERYQAEVLIHRSLPVEALLGMICHNETVCADIEKLLRPRSLDFKVLARPNWYFS